MKFLRLCRTNKYVVAERALSTRTLDAEVAKPEARLAGPHFGSPSSNALVAADVSETSPSSSEASVVEAFRPSPVRVASPACCEPAVILAHSPGSVLPFERPVDSPIPVGVPAPAEAREPAPAEAREQQRDALASAQLLRTDNSFGGKLKLASVPSETDVPHPPTCSLPALKPLKLGFSGAPQPPRPALAPHAGNVPPPFAGNASPDNARGHHKQKGGGAAPEQPGAPRSSKRRAKKSVKWGEADVAEIKVLSPIERRTGVEASFLAVRAKLDAGSFSDEDDDNGFEMPRASVVLRAARQAIEDDLLVDDVVMPF